MINQRIYISEYLAFFVAKRSCISKTTPDWSGGSPYGSWLAFDPWKPVRFAGTPAMPTTPKLLLFIFWCIWHRQLAASATRINAFFLKSNWFHDSHLHWDPYQDNSSQCFAFFSGVTETYIIEPYTCLCPHFISWTVSISADILLVELWRPLPTLSVEMCHNYICPHFVSWTVSISAHVSSESTHKGISYIVPERRHTNTTTKTWIDYCNYYLACE